MTTRTIAGYCAGLVAASALPWPTTATADNYATESGKVLCAVTPGSTQTSYGPDVVACQGPFSQAPQRGAGAVTTSDGTLRGVVGNLNVASPTTTMAYGQTCRSGNWTIYPDQTGTRFTNDRTGHGMFVSIENVSSF
jgi:hypothetical protein